MEFLVVILVAIIVILAIWMYLLSQLPSGFPKGPRPLPILGNLLLMLGDPHDVEKRLVNLSKKYGPIVGLKLGNVPTVLLNDLDSIKEVLVKHGDSFSARPQYLYVVTELTRSPPLGPVRGITWTSDEVWKQTRNLAMSTMRDFGKNTTEGKIQEEVVALCNEFGSYTGGACKPMKLLQSGISNIICSICFGSRFEYSDPDFNKLLALLNEAFRTDLFKSVTNFFPCLRFMPKQGMFTRMMHITRQIDQWIEQEIENHRMTYDPQNIRDFVDLYLSKENNQSDETGQISSYNMYRIIFDLFAAGTETTSAALRWFLLYMIHYPDIQSKVQNEIDTVIGQARVAKLGDRKNMSYLNAVLHETLRVSNIVGLAIPHSSSQDVTVRGYKIPKDTLIFPNTRAVHMDTKLWDQPEEFRPERWIAEDGRFLKKKEGFMPFSVGPRVCLGESLAWNEMFLFTTTMMQRFKVRMSDPSNPPPLQGTIGITHGPVDFEVSFEER